MTPIIKLLGIQSDSTQHLEKIISSLGGLVSIFSILWLTSLIVSPASAGLIVASMGASAVLLFAVPHGPLSQPWPLIGGHFLSAFIGVSCFLFIPNLLLAAAVAVGLSIAVMYYARCIHPPGGATALTAVVGGMDIHQLGYNFLLTPVLINVGIILFIAIVFNLPFKWRRYPVSLGGKPKTAADTAKACDKVDVIPDIDLEFALRAQQSFTDITEEDLANIYIMAARHQHTRQLSAEDIKLGHYYIHGKTDGSGVIRRVIDESSDDKDMIIYKIISGLDKGKTQFTSREAFAQWAKHEVIYEDEQWHYKH